MSQETTYRGKLGDYQRLLASLTANEAELSHLQGLRERFEAVYGQASAAATRQDSLTAAKQETSQQIKALLTEGDRLAHLLRKSVQHHYGIRSEKVVEFGVQPFRGRKAKEKPAPETPPPAASPTEPAPTGSTRS
jgi:hypothetical protein